MIFLTFSHHYTIVEPVQVEVIPQWVHFFISRPESSIIRLRGLRRIRVQLLHFSSVSRCRRQCGKDFAPHLANTLQSLRGID
jgi:uncharacterized protein (DUF983 family)